MARTVKHAKLDSRSARAKLKRGRQAAWRDVVSGALHAHLGYQIKQGEREGRWLLRRYLGGGNRYTITPLGRADDVAPADGERVLSFEEAEAKARAMVDAPAATIARLTVRGALERYIYYKRSVGASVSDVRQSRRLGTKAQAVPRSTWPSSNAKFKAALRHRQHAIGRGAATADIFIVLRLGPIIDLARFRAVLRWHRGERGEPTAQSLSRQLADDHVAEYGQNMSGPARDTIAEAQRLINASDADFRPLVRAALETGARYSELARLEVVDFNADAGTVAIRKSKTGKARHIVLTDEGAAFFQEMTIGRSGSELMFGAAWVKSTQARPMREACERANLKPPIGFHGLRHTWASLSVMAGVPLMVVARNLGHTDTRMVEKHYGHLAPSYIADAIRAGAPKFGIKPDKRVVPIR